MKLFQVWAATFLGDISQDFAKCGLQLFQGVLILHCSVIGQRQCSLIGHHWFLIGQIVIGPKLSCNLIWEAGLSVSVQCSEIQFQVPACNFSRRHW